VDVGIVPVSKTASSRLRWTHTIGKNKLHDELCKKRNLQQHDRTEMKLEEKGKQSNSRERERERVKKKAD